ncbi:hypothetical protein OFB83_33795, partial [Escherichia coli]|nr:hypothetical protein [Escherichia coli]
MQFASLFPSCDDSHRGPNETVAPMPPGAAPFDRAAWSARAQRRMMEIEEVTSVTSRAKQEALLKDA